LDIVPHAVRVECAENAERAIQIKTTLQSDKHHSAACLCTFKAGLKQAHILRQVHSGPVLMFLSRRSARCWPAWPCRVDNDRLSQLISPHLLAESFRNRTPFMLLPTILHDLILVNVLVQLEVSLLTKSI
jgi:hypothetical protein